MSLMEERIGKGKKEKRRKGKLMEFLCQRRVAETSPRPETENCAEMPLRVTCCTVVYYSFFKGWAGIVFEMLEKLC